MTNPWLLWFKAALVPCLLMLIITPLIVYKLEPPTLKDTPEAPVQAQQRLKEMGPMDRDQLIMTGVIVGAVVLWIFGEKIGVAAVTAAMLGLSALLLTGVLNWKDVLGYTPAWDTFLWFSVLVGLSQQLNQLGVISVFSNKVGSYLQSLSIGWLPLMGVLNIVYILLHYFFASQTAHVGALYAAFLALLMQAGAPPVLAAFTLAQSSNLIGSLTHYASGQSAVYFGSGYLEVKDVFIQGFIMCTLSVIVWSTVGLAWWKLVGLF